MTVLGVLRQLGLFQARGPSGGDSSVHEAGHSGSRSLPSCPPASPTSQWLSEGDQG